MFKDRQYYVDKAKSYLGMAVSAIVFDAILLLLFV